ncbi:MAG: hypothetical protein OEY86_17280 [Nitrospira sp.]|nr:hypothetical protein [Nitrospira sp.]
MMPTQLNYDTQSRPSSILTDDCPKYWRTTQFAKLIDYTNRLWARTTPCLTFLVFGLSLEASAASFDCTKATSPVEKLICADTELSNLDKNLAITYRAARRAGLSDSQRVEQQTWIRQRNSCDSMECVKQLYEARIAELANLAETIPSPSPENLGSYEYVVTCNSQNKTLSIHEWNAPGTDPPEAGVVEHRIQPGALTKFDDSETQPLRVPASTERFQCRLGKALYHITIAPHIFNARVMGQCGAAEPVISAAVTRNGKVLLSDQRFATCLSQSRTIHRIRFDERTQSIRILATPDTVFLPMRIEKTFKFSTLPQNLETAVFEAYPTGDVDVDLFMAVRRHNINDVREALSNGASPNARDLNGFTAIAQLWHSSWGADEEEIARLLFEKGASGNVRNIHDVSLLNFLILGDAPQSVIDLLLRNGADPKTDMSLRSASRRGDPELVEKLLALGADPNMKGSDDATALLDASSSGFYSGPNTPTPPIHDYVQCVRILLQHGAKVDAATRDPEALLRILVGSFWKDERLKWILNELIPYSSDSAVKRAYGVTLAHTGTQEGDAFRDWFTQYVHP